MISTVPTVPYVFEYSDGRYVACFPLLWFSFFFML